MRSKGDVRQKGTSVEGIGSVTGKKERLLLGGGVWIAGGQNHHEEKKTDGDRFKELHRMAAP